RRAAGERLHRLRHDPGSRLLGPLPQGRGVRGKGPDRKLIHQPVLAQGQPGPAQGRACRRRCRPPLRRPAERSPRLPDRAEEMSPRRDRSPLSSPILIGALTVLAVIVAVFLAYNANSGLPFVPSYSLHVQVADANELT